MGRERGCVCDSLPPYTQTLNHSTVPDLVTLEGLHKCNQKKDILQITSKWKTIYHVQSLYEVWEFLTLKSPIQYIVDQYYNLIHFLCNAWKTMSHQTHPSLCVIHWRWFVLGLASYPDSVGGKKNISLLHVVWVRGYIGQTLSHHVPHKSLACEGLVGCSLQDYYRHTRSCFSHLLLPLKVILLLLRDLATRWWTCTSEGVGGWRGKFI